MNKYFIIGFILLTGFVLGQLFQKIRLPKILGYLLAGLVTNPQICHLIPKNITSQTDVVENIAIAFIAFAIGGTIVFSEIKKLGKGILYITLFEAEVTFLAITLGFLAILPFVTDLPQASWFATFIPFALLLGCLGSPTDPSVALALNHQYKSKGEVTSTMLSVGAFDDVLGIINFSVAVVLAQSIATHQTFSAYNAFIVPLFIIIGSIILGCLMGMAFNFISLIINKQTEGVFFVLTLSLISLCWGLATICHVEEILSIMVMGIFVTNFNKAPDKIFKMLERYSEELIFLIFFTISGMHLDFSLPPIVFALVIFFVILRILGKFFGTALGGIIAKSSPKVRKYTPSGLIPFGGIVIGLALILNQNPAFKQISNYLVSIIVGGTIINEFIGPIFVKRALKSSGEITVDD